MLLRILRYAQLVALVSIVRFASPVAAQHVDVQVQAVDGKLTTGGDFDDGSSLWGQRVWLSFMNSSYAVNNPGFNAAGTMTGTPPPGSDALPGAMDLSWDFLPMKVGATTSNLLYWNGAGTTPASVSFGLTPGAEYSLSLFGKNNARAAADGSGRLVPGNVIETTAADGFMHIHRFFFLDNDHDDNNATVAADGVYLIAIRLRMSALDRSDPFYIVWGTPGATTAALQAAAAWVDDRVDQLAPNFAADFDGDLEVDGSDWLIWQRGLGTNAGALQIQGDADRDHAVTASDLDVWQLEYGSSLANFQGATVSSPLAAAPEPANAVLTASALMAFATQRRRLKPLGMGR
jgi:hypothetical protein